MTTNGHTNGYSNGTNDSEKKNYDKLTHKIFSSKNPFFSLEFFPPRTKEGAVNLYSRFDRLKSGEPLFVDVTWHAASNVYKDVVPIDSIDSISIANRALSSGHEVILHLTCVGLKLNVIDKLLARIKSSCIRNLLLLRGDKPDENEEANMDFKHPVDLIRYIRSKHGDYFTIAVSGYPSGHPESISYMDDLLYLKGKIEAGADFVITQLFFEAETFIKFVKDCRNMGITVPILPGVMPIQSYDSLKQIAKLSKLTVPASICEKLTPIKDNDEAIRKYGIDQCVNMCKKILDEGICPGIHFFTLNREVIVVTILEKLGLWNNSNITIKSQQITQNG